MNGDKCLGVGCMNCSKETVLYNGTYWCSSCGWVPPIKDQNRYLAGLIRFRRTKGLDTEREELYLPLGHELRTHERTA